MSLGEALQNPGTPGGVSRECSHAPEVEQSVTCSQSNQVLLVETCPPSQKGLLES